MSKQNQTFPDNPQIEVIKSGKTGLFTNYIFKAIPLAFDESLSYYECLCGLLDYLKNVIIPTVNNNADAVAELQTLYEELRSYVENYFDNLDVQEEINNKLDSLVSDGTLDLIINQKLFNNFNDTLNNLQEEVTAQNQNIETINTKVNAIEDISPIPVSNISEMTDTTKIYVNTTDGNWYYYDGSNWVIGGVYQSSQNVLNIYGTLINSANYKERLPNLNGAEINNIYSLLFSTAETNLPLNLPVRPVGTVCTLICFKDNLTIKQLYITERDIFYRTKYSSQNWGDWNQLNRKSFYQIVSKDNFNEILPNLNNISKESTYILNFKENDEKPLNFPQLQSNEYSINLLKTYMTRTEDNASYFRVQILQTSSNTYYRYSNNVNWSNWNDLRTIQSNTIKSDNYETLLPDLNTINRTMTYSLLFGTAETNLPLNLPAQPTGNIDTLQHFAFNNARAIQIYYTVDNIYYRYKYNNIWRDWKTYSIEFLKYADVPKIFYIGANEQYTSLKEGIEEAVKYPNSTVYVKEGTYNLYEEFGGDEYFNNYSSSSSVRGIYLKNNVHVIFSSNSKVVFNYLGDNEDVMKTFSPFNSAGSGFTLENCTIESSRCRYAVHDERGSSSESYKNNYKNCKITYDSTNGGYIQCIGGGLGRNGEIIIENCEFSNPSANDTTGIVSYHNNNSSSDTESKSRIIVKDNYFQQGTFRLSWCGVSNLITDCLVTNNKLNSNIIHTAEREGTDIIKNTRVIEWNNIIN